MPSLLRIKVILFLSIVVLPFAGFSQQLFKIKMHPKSKMPIPPNCKLLYKNIFIDETEIDNIHYAEYLYYIKKDSSEKFYLSQLPDSTVFESSYLKKYNNMPRYSYYPLVGVSYEQAKNFCLWRSAIVNNNLSKKYDKKLDGPKASFKFRLPTKAEWEYAAKGGFLAEPERYGMLDPQKSLYQEIDIDEYKGYKEVLDSLKLEYGKRSNFYHLTINTSDNFVFGNYYFNAFEKGQPEYILQSPPNNCGLRDMIGNVAEMVQEKGIAKGGSYKDSLPQITIEKDYHYSKPQAWLGFRCICEVEYEKN